jgi:hypothetical protein
MKTTIYELSRQGLIDLIEDYDDEINNDTTVSNFLNNKTIRGFEYEPAKAVEFVDPMNVSINGVLSEFVDAGSDAVLEMGAFVGCMKELLAVAKH